MDKMFCFQCEQTANGSACRQTGICGKNPDVANLQDELTDSLIKLANTMPETEENTNILIKGLFTTITNVNFDSKTIQKEIDKIVEKAGSKDFDIICSMIRIMVKSYGCKFIIFDHIKVILDALSVKDKVSAADKIISDLNTLIQELNCFLIVCTHLRKTTINTKSFEEGAIIHLDDFYGAGALKQYANYCIGIERNKNAADKNVRNKIKLRFLKDRYTGEADGEVVYLNFIPETGRVIQSVKQSKSGEDEDIETEFMESDDF